MKQTTRDNIIYLTVALTIAGLVVLDFVVAMRHGAEMWRPTHFEFHVVAYWLVLAYYIAAETRNLGATVMQIVGCEFVGAIIHLGIVYTFRNVFAEPLGWWLFMLALAEFFVIVELARRIVRRLRTRHSAV